MNCLCGSFLGFGADVESNGADVESNDTPYTSPYRCFHREIRKSEITFNLNGSFGSSFGLVMSNKIRGTVSFNSSVGKIEYSSVSEVGSRNTADICFDNDRNTLIC